MEAISSAAKSVSSNVTLAMTGTEGLKKAFSNTQAYMTSCQAAATVVFCGCIALAMHVYRFHKRKYTEVGKLVGGIIGDTVRMIVMALVIAFACEHVSAAAANTVVPILACSLYADVFWDLFKAVF